MSAHLDLDDVCNGHPKAQAELAALRAEVEQLRQQVADLTATLDANWVTHHTDACAAAIQATAERK